MERDLKIAEPMKSGQKLVSVTMSSTCLIILVNLSRNIITDFACSEKGKCRTLVSQLSK